MTQLEQLQSALAYVLRTDLSRRSRARWAGYRSPAAALQIDGEKEKKPNHQIENAEPQIPRVLLLLFETTSYRILPPRTIAGRKMRAKLVISHRLAPTNVVLNTQLRARPCASAAIGPASARGND